MGDCLPTPEISVESVSPQSIAIAIGPARKPSADGTAAIIVATAVIRIGPALRTAKAAGGLAKYANQHNICAGICRPLELGLVFW